jgi:predicted amidohydrolase
VLTLGAGQIRCELGDVQANLEKHLEMIEEARDRGVDLVVFPELSLTGYQLERRTLDVAMRRDDPVIRRLAEAAKGLTVVAGFVEEGPSAQFHNAAALVRDGKLLFIHRKLNLATYGNLEEDKYFAEGRYVEVCRQDSSWIASVLICADLWNPALVHLAALHGATLLLAPVASSVDAVGGDFSNPQGWETALSFYAMLYGMPVVMTNHCGESGGLRFWGGSRIMGAHGKTIACAGDEEGLYTAQVDYQELRWCRFQLPTVRDSNLDLIAREIQRLSGRIGVPEMVRQM